ncbi:hypothetical protein OEW28_09390 [Defluviimonas sp. WL0002]|uniref:Uncharacterized protein n=1 Tax=Albidovulum marisflavi TaxID=2984159 RepID=A0ABT2ZCP5_9RHOB|nr:hypothetical protein [Defluviimonas sp. WL0002]MCV2868840.1 hypothetical protein [Defluviimonas sp. WL0002]
MHRSIQLALFSLKQQALYGLWKSGADMFGGTERRFRTVAYLRLRDLAADELRKVRG